MGGKEMGERTVFDRKSSTPEKRSLRGQRGSGTRFLQGAKIGGAEDSAAGAETGFRVHEALRERAKRPGWSRSRKRKSWAKEIAKTRVLG